MKTFVFQFLLFLLLTIEVVSGQKIEFSAAHSLVQATTHSPSYPVIKGLSTNPIVRLAISVPARSVVEQFSSIKGSINAAAISSIKHIDLFLTGAQPFEAGTPLGTFQPITNFEAQINLTLKPGVHFIWFSVVLKPDANIDGTIELLCSELVNANGKGVAISKDESNYTKRIGTAVRKAWDDSVHTYRIPGLVTTDKGTLVAVYDNRYSSAKDLPGNIDVGMSRSKDGGTTWESMKVIMDMGPPHSNNGIGDPSILFDPVGKRIWVAALWSKGNRSIAGSAPGISPDTTGQFVVVSSDDDGQTWSKPTSITIQIKNPAWHIFFNGPGNGIAMKDGKLVFAAQYWDENKIPFSTIIFSDNGGKNWKGHIAGPKSNTTESQVVETTPGNLMLNMRDNRGGYRSIATTTNLGSTWVEHGSSFNLLQDPICMGSLIKANMLVGGYKKDILFFSNPNTFSGRYNMTIKASADLGETWPKSHQILIDERPCYGYSSLTRINENTIGILYEGVRDLYFVKIPIKEIFK